MSEIINAIGLGIIQGLTEFLPISSSGHLEIANYLLGTSSAHSNLLMTVVVHVATALSTIVVFRREVGQLLYGFFKFGRSDEFAFCCKIAVSMIPAALVGLCFEEQVDSLFKQNMLLVGSMLGVTGLLLLFADWKKSGNRSVGYLDAAVIGIAQAVAILPGISRSGATIGTSLLLGIDRSTAARFSFLMVVPLIFGKIAKDVLDSIISGEPLVGTSQQWPLMAGFAAAFFTGLLACNWMIRIVKASKLYYFAFYCFAVAALTIAAGLKWY
jgi:undecaprenyl-diphosphatase